MRNTLRYYIKGYKQPEMNMTLISRKPDKLTMALSMNGLVMGLLLISSLLSFLLDRSPTLEPLLATESYYLWQSIYVVPLLLVLWVMTSGVLYLLAITGKSATRRFFFDDALIVTSFAFVLSWLPIVAIPNLLLAIGGFHLPILVEVIRVFVLPLLVQLVYMVIGAKSIYKTSLLKSILVSLITLITLYGFVWVFIR